jgi:hypothetical protein
VQVAGRAAIDREVDDVEVAEFSQRHLGGLRLAGTSPSTARLRCSRPASTSSAGWLLAGGLRPMRAGEVVIGGVGEHQAAGAIAEEGGLAEAGEHGARRGEWSGATGSVTTGAGAAISAIQLVLRRGRSA